MKVEVSKNVSYVDEIVQIHMATFTGFFLTFLGRGFLRQLYKGFMEHPHSGVIVAKENDRIVGFCAFSEDLSGFYKYLIKKKLILFAWYALGAFLRKPKVLFRLLRAFTYSGDSKREEAYIELSSIGVLPDIKSKGVGTQMITLLKEISDGTRFEYIKLETDRDNNEGANHFYQKNGFALNHSYETPEGRGMNEYRFYFGEI
jgi:ribosomal protein S18 acetylase RimI-like enzyme